MTQSEALTILKTGANVFLTGEPGSGKTHTINEYVKYLHAHAITPAITASTGIAATHIGGMTIHSWSGLGIRTELDRYALDKIATTEYVAKRIHQTKVLIIDEISMLHSNMLTMIDRVIREVKGTDEPFGGMQVILVGDFFQLPPISKENGSRGISKTRKSIFDETEFTYDFSENTKPALPELDSDFAFKSSSWASLKPVVCYLTEQHRQDDDVYLSVLSAIRSNKFDSTHQSYLEERIVTDSNLPEAMTRLFSHNANVDELNNTMLKGLASVAHTYTMSSQGKEALVASLKKGCLSPEELTLRVGAKVMCTKNNQNAGFVNGTLGVIIDFEKGSLSPIIKTTSGKQITIEPQTWSIEENGKIRASISQIPLRLAWAITVHKSQGMSLDEALMDLRDIFEYGQGYVALSRVRRLSGLHIIGWNEKTFKVHPEILKVDEMLRTQSENARIAFSALSDNELTTMYSNFITASGGRLMSNITTDTLHIKNKELSTRHITLGLLREGHSLEEIIDTRNLKAETILSHIEDLIRERVIAPHEITRLLKPEVTDSLSYIHNIFRELDTDKLTPVYEALDGKYSYTELRIARILLNA